MYCTLRRTNTATTTLMTSGEWLKYTVYAPESGVFNVTARYATLADSTALAITVDDGTNLPCKKDSDGLVLYDSLLPSTDAWDVWADTDKVGCCFSSYILHATWHHSCQQRRCVCLASW